MYLSIFVRMSMYVCMLYMRMYIYIYVCMYIYIHMYIKVLLRLPCIDCYSLSQDASFHRSPTFIEPNTTPCQAQIWTTQALMRGYRMNY